MGVSRGTLGIGYVGFARAVGATGPRGTLGVGRCQLPVDVTPPPVTYAPDFPGISRLQLRPKDLLGTLALGDPITDLPCLGSLVTGNFSAAGTARPVLQDDGTGRVGALHDGVNDMLEIAGLSLDLSAGFTFFVVERQAAATSFRGTMRGDAGSYAAGSSIAEFYWSAGAATSTSNRLTSTSVNSATVAALGLKSWGTNAGASTSLRGIYIDGVRKAGTNNQTGSATAITRMQIAGYSITKCSGYVYDWVLYNAQLTQLQTDEVRDYLRDEWSSGAPF